MYGNAMAKMLMYCSSSKLQYRLGISFKAEEKRLQRILDQECYELNFYITRTIYSKENTYLTTNIFNEK